MSLRHAPNSHAYILNYICGVVLAGQFHSYNIVYQAASEGSEDAQAYIIVFSLNSPRGKVIRFTEFLDAHCKLNNKVAVANQVNNAFPSFNRAQQQRSHVFGNPRQVKGNAE
jgi:hypothetical protein